MGGNDCCFSLTSGFFSLSLFLFPTTSLPLSLKKSINISSDDDLKNKQINGCLWFNKWGNPWEWTIPPIGGRRALADPTKTPGRGPSSTTVQRQGKWPVQEWAGSDLDDWGSAERSPALRTLPQLLPRQSLLRAPVSREPDGTSYGRSGRKMGQRGFPGFPSGWTHPGLPEVWKVWSSQQWPEDTTCLGKQGLPKGSLFCPRWGQITFTSLKMRLTG